MVAVLCVVVLAVLLVVGLMGLKRIDKPEKYRFFLIWGIVLLVFGGIGALLVADFASIRGIANLLWAVAAPIRFIVGALEKKSLGPGPKDRNPCIKGTAAGGYRRLAIEPAGAL